MAVLPDLIPVIPILNEADNERALEIVDAMFGYIDRYSVESHEGQRFIVITECIGAYEKVAYPMDQRHYQVL